MKKIAIFTLILLLLALLTTPAFAYQVTVRDELSATGTPTGAEIYTYTVADGTDAGGVAYYLWSKKAASKGSLPTDSAVAATLGFSEDSAAVVLLVRQVGTTYYYDMYTYGAANDIFSDAAVNQILDNTGVYSKLKGGDISGGAFDFFNLCTEQILYVAEKEAAREATKPFRVLLFSLIIGALAGGFTALGIALHYRRKKRGSSYPLDRYARLNLTLHEDRFVGSFVTRTRIQSNNSSGGGGGGGHRGGR